MKPTTAQKKRIQKWIEALRSGDYKQGKHALKNREGSFCCLGVACDLFKRGVKGKWVGGNVVAWDNIFRITAASHSSTALPNEVRDYLGFHDNLGSFLADELPAKLQKRVKKLQPASCRIGLDELNDRGASFKLIADILEAAPPSMFDPPTW